MRFAVLDVERQKLGQLLRRLQENRPGRLSEAAGI